MSKRHRSKPVQQTRSAGLSSHLQPGNAGLASDFAYANLSLSSQQFDEAERVYRKILEISPDFPEVISNLGVLLMETGRFAESEKSYKRALALQPDNAETQNNLGNLFLETGHFEDAMAAFSTALKLRPAYLDAHNNLGKLLLQTQQFDAAEKAFSLALSLQPDSPDTYNNLGNLYRSTKRFEDAKIAYQYAIKLKPTHANANINLANVFVDTAHFDDAESYYRKALAIEPENLHAQYNFGCFLLNSRRFREARIHFDHVFNLKPDWVRSAAQSFYCASHLCDWANRSETEAMLALAIGRGAVGISPFSLLLLNGHEHGRSGLFQRRAAELFASSEYRGQLDAAIALLPLRPADERLRLGYLSADFHSHATMHLLRGVLSTHDRARFAIYGYSYGAIQDETTVQASSSCEIFRDLTCLSDSAAAGQIAADQIDILIDLKGFTANTRLGISAQRPAPITVSWLGYPGTLGHASLADYIISDAVVSPASHASHFSETLALMPYCYQPNDREKQIGPKPTRREVGLPETGFVFCSFNQSYKLNPSLFDLWCRLLKAVPGSVLWLLAAPGEAAENLRREAKNSGIDSQRLIFAPNLSLAEHLGRLQLADLALDTFPVTSHTTASDALWACVPLVTRMGDSFVSRVAASLLINIGMSDLVAQDEDSYFALARSLALEPTRLAEVRQRLAANRLTTPLFDTSTFTTDLERLYVRMWEQYQQGVKEIIELEPASEVTQFTENKTKFAIVRVHPENDVHYHVFDEVVESLVAGFIENGLSVRVVDNEVDQHAINIIISAHLLNDEQLDALPQNTILYNFEQFDLKSNWMREAYINALASHHCWDYSQRNISALTMLRPDACPKYVPVGYEPFLTRLEKSSEDIDILFYGSVNPRRKKILDALIASGFNVYIAFNVYGSARDDLIRRSKLILNLHFYESHILEVVRVSYLMANSKAVVSECADDTEVYSHLRDGLCLVPYGHLVNSCIDLLANTTKRKQLENNALLAIKKLTCTEVLMGISLRGLDQPIIDESGKVNTLPKMLNLGSGKDWREDFLNADILARSNPDWLLDICQPLPFGGVVSTLRFGGFELAPGQFDLIMANDVLEHLPDLVTAMTACLALLKVGGEMHIQVPYDLSYGAWQDPTHIRAFNERSWLYYTDWYWYLGWKTERFLMVKEEFILSPVGMELKEKNVPVPDILRTPRAVDSMRVVLQKIAITEA